MCTWIAGEISRHKAKSCLLYKYTSIHRFHISFDENQDFVKPHSNTLTVTKYGLQVQINSFFFSTSLDCVIHFNSFLWGLCKGWVGFWLKLGRLFLEAQHQAYEQSNPHSANQMYVPLTLARITHLLKYLWNFSITYWS